MAEKIKLTDEELAWFELAYQFRMPVTTLKEQITLSEFLQWREFLRLRQERHDKEHFYWAQIAAEICKGRAKHPERIKIKDFLLRFQTSEEEEVERTEAAMHHRTMMSKGKWFMAVGFKPKHQEN